MTAVLLILFAGLSPRGMRAIFGSFFINPLIIRGVYNMNDVVRDLITNCGYVGLGCLQSSENIFLFE